MAHGMRVVGVELVHNDDFSKVSANLAVLVGEPGAGTRLDEQVDLRQLARHAGVRDAWVVPDREMPEPFREALILRVPGIPSAG